MQWSTLKKFNFCFLASYLLLYILSNQFILSSFFNVIWKPLIPWFGKHVLHLSEDITIFPNGSGDTTYNYVSLLVYISLALIIAAILSIADRKRTDYNYLFLWLIIIVRYYIIFQMLIYGFAKVFYLQFQPPSFTRLLQPYGDSSPMGLLWTFMGYSKGYTMFTGFSEVLGGLLLLTPRFRTVGAMVVFGVMANVMALNFFYDVPVKILSTHLVLMSLFLLLLDRKRLWNFFFANRPTTAIAYPTIIKDPVGIKVINRAKWVLIIIGLAVGSFFFIKNNPQMKKPLLYGLYEVESFKKNGLELPPLITDSLRWQYLSIQGKGRARIKRVDGSSINYRFVPDTALQQIVYNGLGKNCKVDSFYYSQPDSLHLQLAGTHLGDSLHIVMRLKNKEDFLLINRGFHWVSEYPFNR